MEPSTSLSALVSVHIPKSAQSDIATSHTSTIQELKEKFAQKSQHQQVSKQEEEVNKLGETNESQPSLSSPSNQPDTGTTHVGSTASSIPSSSPPPSKSVSSHPIEALALYSFAAPIIGQLRFSKGEILTLKSSQAAHGWLMAENSEGKKGHVPEAYVEIVVKANEHEQQQPQQQQEKVEATSSTPPKENLLPSAASTEAIPVETKTQDPAPQLSSNSEVVDKKLSSLIPSSPDGSTLKRHASHSPPSSPPTTASQSVSRSPPASASTHLRALTLYSFKAPVIGQLAFRTGEVLQLIGQPIAGWIMAENSEGKKGHVPENYVKIIQAPDEIPVVDDVRSTGVMRQTDPLEEKYPSHTPTSQDHDDTKSGNNENEDDDDDRDDGGNDVFLQQLNPYHVDPSLPPLTIQVADSSNEIAYPPSLHPQSRQFDSTNMAFADVELARDEMVAIADEFELDISITTPSQAPETSTHTGHMKQHDFEPTPVIQSVVLQRHPKQYSSFPLFPFILSHYDHMRRLDEGLLTTYESMESLAPDYGVNEDDQPFTEAELLSMSPSAAELFDQVSSSPTLRDIHSSLSSEIDSYVAQYYRHHQSAIYDILEHPEVDYFDSAVTLEEFIQYDRDRKQLIERESAIQQLERELAKKARKESKRSQQLQEAQSRQDEYNQQSMCDDGYDDGDNRPLAVQETIVEETEDDDADDDDRIHPLQDDGAIHPPQNRVASSHSQSNNRQDLTDDQPDVEAEPMIEEDDFNASHHDHHGDDEDYHHHHDSSSVYANNVAGFASPPNAYQQQSNSTTHVVPFSPSHHDDDGSHTHRYDFHSHPQRSTNQAPANVSSWATQRISSQIEGGN